MQCPVSVEGGECGADAVTQLSWTNRRYDALAIHFSCKHGHRFHIGPRERWQVCRCHGADATATGPNGIQAFVPDAQS